VIDLPASVRPLFIAAGWRPGRALSIVCDELEALRSYPLATEVLGAFGGLHVGKCGHGRDCATSDILFTTRPSREGRWCVIDRESPGDDLFPLGEAHRAHLELFLDAQGRLFAYAIPDGRLWVVGESFSEGVERLLLGHKAAECDPA
jgi:SUKH-3 immunity protein